MKKILEKLNENYYFRKFYYTFIAKQYQMQIDMETAEGLIYIIIYDNIERKIIEESVIGDKIPGYNYPITG